MPETDNIPEFTVSALSGKVKRTLEDAFGYVRVRGELGRVNRHGSGHVYLDLKDDKAVLASVIWKGVASRLKVAPEQGMEVIATGRVTTFAGQSKYQLIIERLEPAGAGALMALFEARKKALEAEGLFAEERKKPLPRLPRVIGVVTSPTGAVIRDILHRLRDRYPSHVIVWPTAVQGDRAPPQIIAGIEGFNAAASGGLVPRPDVLIVARGGGSLEDLWCFNDEGVARAVAASDIPIISAVGHETDTTLIDFVSDRRAPTPTAAAEMAVPVRIELLQRIEAAGARLTAASARRYEEQRLAFVAAARGLGRPDSLLEAPAQRLDRAQDMLSSALTRIADRRLAAYNAVAGRLQPTAVRAFAQRAAERLAVATSSLPRGLVQRTALAAGALEKHRLPQRALAGRVNELQRRSIELGGRLNAAADRRLVHEQHALGQRARLLDSYSYKGVLERGFVLVTDEEGGVVRRRADATAGQAVELRFADDTVAAVIGSGDGEAPKPTAPAKRSRPTKQAKEKRKPTEQSELFGD